MHEVIVENVGSVYYGNSEKEARAKPARQNNRELGVPSDSPLARARR